MCYLGKQTDSTSSAPFNSIGSFELIDPITAVEQSSAVESTRNTIRLRLEVRVPGTVTCIVKDRESATTADQLKSASMFEGRAAAEVEPPSDGTDPEYPQDSGETTCLNTTCLTHVFFKRGD